MMSTLARSSATVAVTAVDWCHAGGMCLLLGLTRPVSLRWGFWAVFVHLAEAGCQHMTPCLICRLAARALAVCASVCGSQQACRCSAGRLYAAWVTVGGVGFWGVMHAAHDDIAMDFVLPEDALNDVRSTA
jgi:hypothetical protein